MSNDQVSTTLSAGTWSGALLGGVGALTFTEWLAIGGFLLAVGGFFVNLWHKRSIVKIARAELELKIKASE